MMRGWLDPIKHELVRRLDGVDWKARPGELPKAVQEVMNIFAGQETAYMEERVLRSYAPTVAVRLSLAWLLRTQPSP